MEQKKGFMKTLLGVMLTIFLGITVLFAGENPLKITTIQDDLYLITGMRWDINVTFLVTADGVLVVDSGNDVAEGRWVIEKIKEKTDKPISTVILTHYHFDHTLGLLGFPKDLTIIAHNNCAKNMTQSNENRFKWLIEKGLPGEIQELQKKIADLKEENNLDAEKEEKQLKSIKQRLEDFKKAKLVHPNITFDKKLTLVMGKEKIEIIYPGNAHTNGNALIYLPARKVMIMGDMLFHGYIPYIDWQAGSDTKKWIAWMEKLSQWDIETVIPGHGEVTNKAAFEKKKRYLTDLRKSIKEAIDKGMSLEEMQKSVKMTDYKDLQFFEYLSSNIEAVYQELKKTK